MSRAPVLIFGALAFCAATSSSQTIVDPGGGGHYRDLQAGIDGTPAGGVIKVIGGTYGSLRINKTLTILGAPAPTIASPPDGRGSQPPGIELAGSGGESLTLDNIRIEGVANGIQWGVAGPGIAGSGFQRLRMQRCFVKGHQFINPTGEAGGASAIALAGAAQLVVSGSTCNASHGIVDYPDSFGYDGVPGIDAPGATVVLLDSTVNGGNARDSVWPATLQPPSPCPCGGQRGTGGAGIVAKELFESASLVLGGKGAMHSYYYSSSGQRYPWGKQPDGAPYIVPMRVHILSGLEASPAVLGRNWDLRIFSGGNSVLLLGGFASPPSRALGSWFFLDPAAIYFVTFVANSTTRVTFPVPNDIALAGVQIAAQLAGATTLSRPVFTVIGF